MDAIRRYFEAFNAGDVSAMLAELSDNVAHHVNEGQVRQGKEMFKAFCDHMNESYSEKLTDMVILSNEDGTRGAAEYTVNGTYLKTDAGLPEARGQTYKLPAGSFFELKDNKISRVTTYYNLADWTAQVG